MDKMVENYFVGLARYDENEDPESLDNQNKKIATTNFNQYSSEQIVSEGVSYIKNNSLSIWNAFLFNKKEEVVFNNIRNGRFNPLKSLFWIEDLIKFRGIILSKGEDGISALAPMNFLKEEDLMAISAIMLCFQTFTRPANISNIQRAYNSAFGTSCKIALASAMIKHGGPFAFDNYANPIIKVLGNKLPMFQSSSALIPDIVLLDIVTKGQLFPSIYPNWQKV